ncbi:MAG: CDP-diacylglycerol--glycerol-3-phosphate 3-phosphatidyltransferase [Planctomycetaceae bacterium]|nr:CDP-diacylglycerol--glycerol-3-phosphate 3-phosphatidyltransferase [Planctomycetaceae bacterium]
MSNVSHTWWWKNLPNIITVSRLVLAFILFAMISAWPGSLGLAAAILFLLAAATDAADGYIARRYNLISTFGRIVDPFADKIIVCGTFIFLVEHSAQSGVTALMAAIVVGREMFVTGLRSFLEQQGKDFSATWSGKLKMILQCAALTLSLLTFDPNFQSPDWLRYRDFSLWAAVALTFYSGAIYAIRGVQLLKPSS